MKKLNYLKNIEFFLWTILERIQMLNKSRMQDLHITVKLKSFSTVYLNRFLVLAFQAIRFKLSTTVQCVYLPKKIERITLLKSPHIYKKAREQFERITYMRVFSFVISDSQENQKVLYRLLAVLGSFSQGVSVQFTYTISQTNCVVSKTNKI